MASKRWTEEDLLELLIEYCQIPFGRMHSKNPDIVRLATRLSRTPSAVALKMVNFASLDPTIDRKGMSNVSALDRRVWDEFFSNIDRYLNRDEDHDGGLSERSQERFELVPPYAGEDVIAIAKIRRGQQWFRRTVLASYERRCAISGISNELILVASHIAPWATHKDRRLDPRNGICLNALYDRAFDAGIIAFSDDYKILFSPHLSNDDVEKLLRTGAELRPPHKFAPDVELLREHRRRFGFP